MSTSPVEAIVAELDGLTLEEAKAKLIREMAAADGRPVPEPGDCPTCGARPPHVYRDQLSVEEARISGMCQQCQDSVFGEEE